MNRRRLLYRSLFLRSPRRARATILEKCEFYSWRHVPQWRSEFDQICDVNQIYAEIKAEYPDFIPPKHG